MTITVPRIAQTVSIAIAVALAAGASGVSAQGEAVVRGEIVDLPCDMVQGSRGAGHPACTQLSANASVTVGAATDGGELFLLVNQSADPRSVRGRDEVGERACMADRQRGQHARCGETSSSDRLSDADDQCRDRRVGASRRAGHHVIRRSAGHEPSHHVGKKRVGVRIDGLAGN